MTSSPSTRSLLFGRGSLSIYLPSLLIAIGEGAILPTLPSTATALGANLALAGLISGLIMIGEVVGDIPSGWVVSRFGENTSMIGGSVVIAAGVVMCLTAQNLALFAAGVALIGVATAVFALARHSLITTTTPLAVRARALSLLGGTFRAGYFVGPFIAAAVIPIAGTQAVFIIPLVACVATVVALAVLPDPASLPDRGVILHAAGPSDTADAATASITPTAAAQTVTGGRDGLFATLWSFRRTLAQMGSGALIIGLLRSSRQAILPLWAVHLNIDASHTAIIVGIAGAVDFALFYSSGQIMDRFGRAWSAVPSLLGLGLGHIALAFATDTPSFTIVAIALSIANGVGSGILMTLGADLAPRDDPAPFLGAWRFFSDTGSAAAPFLIAGLTAAVSLALPAVAIGALGVGGAALMARYIPRYVPRVR